MINAAGVPETVRHTSPLRQWRLPFAVETAVKVIHGGRQTVSPVIELIPQCPANAVIMPMTSSFFGGCD